MASSPAIATDQATGSSSSASHPYPGENTRRPSGEIETRHTPNPDAIAIFADSVLYVNLDECTSCTACYQPDVCPVGAIYSEEQVPDGTSNTKYNSEDANKGHDHTFFIQHSRDVFAD